MMKRKEFNIIFIMSGFVDRMKAKRLTMEGNAHAIRGLVRCIHIYNLLTF